MQPKGGGHSTGSFFLLCAVESLRWVKMARLAALAPVGVGRLLPKPIGSGVYVTETYSAAPVQAEAAACAGAVSMYDAQRTVYIDL